VTVAAGGSHTCAIRSTDQLACWGKNSKGQLGVGTITTQEGLNYLTVAGGAGWLTVSAGLEHTCAIRSDRTLWCWGKNSSSQLGIGSTALKSVPTKVGTGANWAIVSAGAEHTCAVQFDGSLWCWGLGSNGRLGLSATSTSGVKVPTRVGTENTWKSVATGAAHTCAVKTAGTLWCWGAGGSGRLGRSSTADSKVPVQVGTLATWSSVSTGLAHTCATSTAGALSCWGANTKGEVPGSSSLSVTSPYAATAPTTTGAVWAAVSTGDRETCATPTLGPIVCWGLRSDTATLPQRVGAVGGWSSVDAGIRHTCAINADNALYCWGTNLNGQLGDGSKISRILPSREATSGSDWESVSAGENSTCAIRADGSLYCFGLNSLGQLGTGTTTSSSRPVQESSGRPDWTKVSVGTTHACAVNQDHELFCWGDSAYDQIPAGYAGELDPTLIEPAGSVVDVSSSAVLTCVLQTDRDASCWGLDNGEGDFLGASNVDQIAAGVDVDPMYEWECLINNNSLLDCVNNYADLLDSSLMAVGTSNVCAISITGVLRCTGSNLYGQLGIASYVNDYSGWKTVLDPSLSYLDDPATTDIDESDEEAFGQWVSVSLGDNHACAINLDGTLYCWGSNANGRLGVGSPAEAFAPVVENKWAQPAELDGGPSSATVVTTSVALSPELSLGYEFACSMTNALDIWCVGSNTYGQLGQNNIDDSPTAVKVPLPTGVSAWLGVSAADNFVCAIGRLSASATVG
jgi:alpha-tubulin suppressor-like RCC1 family protein